MQTAKRVGISTFILRDTQHLAAVEVIDDALVLTLLRFADELVDTKQFSLPSSKNLRKAELDMAKALVETLATNLQPDKYTDEYQANLMRIIRAKVKGKNVRLEAATQPHQADVVDLMERLRRSLAGRGTKDVKGLRPAGQKANDVTGRPKKRRVA